MNDAVFAGLGVFAIACYAVLGIMLFIAPIAIWMNCRKIVRETQAMREEMKRHMEYMERLMKYYGDRITGEAQA